MAERKPRKMTDEEVDASVERHAAGLLDALIRRDPKRARRILDGMKDLDEKRSSENSLASECDVGLDS